MVGTLLLRGMLVGILAGLLACGFAKMFGEPQIDLAIAFEEHHQEHEHAAGAAHEHAAGVAHEHEPELVSRDVQSTIGLLTGVVAYGAAIGGIFALAFAYAHGRIGRFGPRGTAAILAIVGFAVIILVPQLKYPANPPAVGDPDTIGQRTALYFVMIAISVVAALVAAGIGQRLVRSLGRWNAGLAAVAAYIVVVSVAALVLPAVNEVPAEFSAVVLWQFRVAALGLQFVLWAALGLGFGALTEHRPSSRAAAARSA